MVLTSPCYKLHTVAPCDVLQLGEQIAAWSRQSDDIFRLDIMSDREQKYALWNILNDLIDTKSAIRDALEDTSKRDLITHYIKSDSVQAMHRDAVEAYLPIARVLFYCSPCACQIHTAINLCTRLNSKMIEAAIRLDDRIVSSCCAAFDRISGLRSILEYILAAEAELETGMPSIGYWVDRTWMEQRLDHFEYEQPYDYHENGASKIVILGEADFLSSMIAKASRSIPKASQIWTLKPTKSSGLPYNATLRCRFVEKRRKATVVESSTREKASHNLAVETENTGLKRGSSSVSSENKRPRTSHRLEDGDLSNGSANPSVNGSSTESVLAHE